MFVCDPPRQTIDELGEALTWTRRVSNSASDCLSYGTNGTHAAMRSEPGEPAHSIEKGTCIMTESDLSALRERAANGDPTAVDILIELAGERGDMAELRRLAEGGSADAADQLIEVVTELGDLDELRRLADSGNITAAEQLAELTED